MQIMECKRCNSKWESTRQIAQCPFCGADLSEKKVASTIEDAFQIIIERHGKDVFSETRKLLAFLSDYAPGLDRERRLMKVAIELGAYKAIYNASATEREQLVNRYAAIMSESYYIDETWAKKALLWCANALGYIHPSSKVDRSPVIIEKDKLEHDVLDSRDDCLSYPSIQSEMDITAGELKKYSGTQEVVTIPNYVHTIGSHAFYGNESVKKLILSPSVKHIGQSAFAYCENLQCVDFSDGLKTIDDWAFTNCPSLDKVSLPDSVVKIGELAFNSCTSLKTIILPNFLTVISELTFKDCTMLENVQFPEALIKIEREAFEGCRALKELVLPETLREIQERAFLYCFNLGHIRISSKTIIHDEVFHNDCNRIQFDYYSPSENINTTEHWTLSDKTLIVSSMDCIPKDEDYSIRDKRRKQWASATKLVLSEGITETVMCAFEGMRDLQEVILPSTLTKIGYGTFKDCYHLKIINIPNGLKTIAARAFDQCNSLSNVSIPASVSYIGDCAFSRCGINNVRVSSDCVICPGNFGIIK